MANPAQPVRESAKNTWLKLNRMRMAVSTVNNLRRGDSLSDGPVRGYWTEGKKWVNVPRVYPPKEAQLF